MLDALFVVAAFTAVAGAVYAYVTSRDVFHPLVFTGPMMAFLYGWMPWKLHQSNSLVLFFSDEQVLFVQVLNCLGVLAFVSGCLCAGTHTSKNMRAPERLGRAGRQILLNGAALCGAIGLAAWSYGIINVGGFANAFGKAYGGGWDDSGYVRDSAILMIAAVILLLALIAQEKVRPVHLLLLAAFSLPWIVQAVLTARRGPTFMITVVLGMGYFLFRKQRPPVLATAIGGLTVGWLILFLVSNRGSIYLGSDFELKTEVTDIVESADTGNEYIYGTGAVLNADKTDKFFWGRRYAAQLLVRPVPSSIWPTKYADFGVPELLNNAGTGEGFFENLGWKAAVGSAPGVVADLWLEAKWGAIVLLWALGWAYGKVWQRAVSVGQLWACQYVILAALSIYLVMQTMEAVIFRTILLSLPVCVAWFWARYVSVQQSVPLGNFNAVPLRSNY